MDWIRAVEIFAFVSGLLYIVLEIGQKNLMWVIGILTGIACACSFSVQRLWASAGLNGYYVLVSVLGLRAWKKDGEKTDPGTLHLRRPTKRTLWVSLAVFGAGTAALVFLLRQLGDPSSVLDSTVTVLSAVGTWWLAKSYPQQWLIWIVADLLSSGLCLGAGMYWMAVLYLCYAVSAVYGYYHWKHKGVYV